MLKASSRLEELASGGGTPKPCISHPRAASEQGRRGGPCGPGPLRRWATPRAVWGAAWLCREGGESMRPVSPKTVSEGLWGP